jgi:hypothetical protein
MNSKIYSDPDVEPYFKYGIVPPSDANLRAP